MEFPWSRCWLSSGGYSNSASLKLSLEAGQLFRGVIYKIKIKFCSLHVRDHGKFHAVQEQTRNQQYRLYIVHDMKCTVYVVFTWTTNSHGRATESYRNQNELAAAARICTYNYLLQHRDTNRVSKV